jgi:hypothetical protein
MTAVVLTALLFKYSHPTQLTLTYAHKFTENRLDVLQQMIGLINSPAI